VRLSHITTDSAHVAAAYLVLSAVNRALERGRVRRIERRPADA
jgi:hypothetical protein